MEPSGLGVNKLLTKNIPHIHEKILLFLDYDTFNNSKGVYKVWDELLESEAFQKKAKSVFKREMEMELLKYSREGDAQKVKRLLSEGVDPNCKEMGITPLYYAVIKGHTSVVQILLCNGADPNIAKNNDRMLQETVIKSRRSLIRGIA